MDRNTHHPSQVGAGAITSATSAQNNKQSQQSDVGPGLYWLVQNRSVLGEPSKKKRVKRVTSGIKVGR